MRYESRQDAGRKLGAHLAGLGVKADLVLGLPRGGVLVAAELAQCLQVPLRVLAARKIGHPLQPEFALGAIAEGGVEFLDPIFPCDDPPIRDQLRSVIAAERAHLHQQETLFHPDGRPPDLRGRSVLIADDGLATGATAAAAVLSARRRGASEIAVAAPVASLSAVERLEALHVAVHVALIDPDFQSVGHFYRDFPQATDAQVLLCLRGRA
ncbi:MAG: phosphoribosyltransferase family protein [Verrucomicrobiota bacterium]